MEEAPPKELRPTPRPTFPQTLPQREARQKTNCDTNNRMRRVIILARENCSLTLKVIRALGPTRAYTIFVVGDESVRAVRWSRYVNGFQSLAEPGDDQRVLAELASCASLGERCILLPVNTEDFRLCAKRHRELVNF